MQTIAIDDPGHLSVFSPTDLLCKNGWIDLGPFKNATSWLSAWHKSLIWSVMDRSWWLLLNDLQQQMQVCTATVIIEFWHWVSAGSECKFALCSSAEPLRDLRSSLRCCSFRCKIYAVTHSFHCVYMHSVVIDPVLSYDLWHFADLLLEFCIEVLLCSCLFYRAV